MFLWLWNSNEYGERIIKTGNSFEMSVLSQTCAVLLLFSMHVSMDWAIRELKAKMVEVRSVLL